MRAGISGGTVLHYETIMTETAATEEAPVDLFGLVGTVLDRKFRIDRVVAEGGFGVVYHGVHLTLEKEVAVKVLKTPPEYNDAARAQFIEKFALEGKTMARISHPNIVQVLDFGACEMPSGGPSPWMVLEWVKGDTVEKLLLNRRGKGPFSVPEALALMRPVLEALAYAHDEGIAHRDIKPANMMVVSTKRGSTLRLMDFGIAKLMDDGEEAGSGATRTRTTMNAFSPQYAAPEQISGTRSGPWTDVHAVALIITEMLTDKPPYDGDDMTALFGQILNPARPTPGNRGGAVTSWEPVISRALAIKPDERYKNAGEFLAALEATLPHGESAGSTTGAFKSLADGLTPAAVSANSSTAVAPTTLRASVVATGVAAVPVRRSRAPLFAVLGVAVALGTGGAFLFLGRSGRHDAPTPHVSVAHAGTPETVLGSTGAGVVGSNSGATVAPNGSSGNTAAQNPAPVIQADAGASANTVADAAAASVVAATHAGSPDPAGTERRAPRDATPRVRPHRPSTNAMPLPIE